MRTKKRRTGRKTGFRSWIRKRKTGKDGVAAVFLRS